jgi:hypothetical protein
MPLRLLVILLLFIFCTLWAQENSDSTQTNESNKQSDWSCRNEKGHAHKNAMGWLDGFTYRRMLCSDNWLGLGINGTLSLMGQHDNNSDPFKASLLYYKTFKVRGSNISCPINSFLEIANEHYTNMNSDSLENKVMLSAGLLPQIFLSDHFEAEFKLAITFIDLYQKKNDSVMQVKGDFNWAFGMLYYF